jgi:hypothetical protein
MFYVLFKWLLAALLAPLVAAFVVEDYLLFVEYVQWSWLRAVDYYELSFTYLRKQFFAGM